MPVLAPSLGPKPEPLGQGQSDHVLHANLELEPERWKVSDGEREGKRLQGACGRGRGAQAASEAPTLTLGLPPPLLYSNRRQAGKIDRA